MTGEELKDLRVKAGLTQAELSKIIDKTITSISRWENDEIKIDPLRADGIKYRLLVSSTEMR